MVSRRLITYDSNGLMSDIDVIVFAFGIDVMDVDCMASVSMVLLKPNG